jgi:hypothetical protein
MARFYHGLFQSQNSAWATHGIAALKSLGTVLKYWYSFAHENEAQTPQPLGRIKAAPVQI